MPGVIEVIVSPSMRTNGHVNEARKCWIQNSKKKKKYCFTHTSLNCVTLQDVVWWILKIYSNSKGDGTK